MRKLTVQLIRIAAATALAGATTAALADSCPGTLYYASGSYLKSGDSYYYQNGSYLISGSSAYYPNGSYLKSGTSYYFSNGSYLQSGTSIYYPSGSYFRSGSSFYYPNGSYLRSGTSYYYQNGSYARSGTTLYTQTGQTTDFPISLTSDFNGDRATFNVGKTSESLRLAFRAVTDTYVDGRINVTLDGVGATFRISPGGSQSGHAVVRFDANGYLSCDLRAD